MVPARSSGSRTFGANEVPKPLVSPICLPPRYRSRTTSPASSIASTLPASSPWLLAAVDDHDLVLADQIGAADDVDDAAVDVAARARAA